MDTRHRTPRAPRAADGKAGRAAGFLTPGRIALLVLALLTLVFIFGNTRRTEVRLLIPEVSMPLWLALLCTGLIGALCGMYLIRRR